MDKKTFISELRAALSVLQADELDDIVNEYEQHIDMKMKNGLTEAEAIADFGSMPKLTADILEAYHVRADYAAGQKNRKSIFGEDGGAKKEILQQTGKKCRAAGQKAVHGLHGLGCWLWGVLLFWKRRLLRPAAWIGESWRKHRSGMVSEMRDEEEILENPDTVQTRKPGQEKEYPGAAEETQSTRGGRACRGISRRRTGGRWFVRMQTGIAAMAGGMGRFAAVCIHTCIKLVFLGAQAAWNGCCIAFALFCACMGMLCLYGLGMLIVLCMQHYPLAGMTIGCLGLTMCMFSAAGFGLTLMWRKKIPYQERKEGQHA